MDTEARLSAMQSIIYISFDGQDLKMLLMLEKHLRQLEPLGVSINHAAYIPPGSDHWQTRTQYINDSDCVLALLSADFMNSEICQKEIDYALRRRSEASLLVVPILLRPTLIESRELRSLQVLPKNGKALSETRNREAALRAIVVEIKHAICRPQETRPSRRVETSQSTMECVSLRRVRITLEGELTTLEDLNEIMRRLRAVCRGSCDLVRVEIGSIILTIAVTEEALGSLLEVWRTGRFSNEIGIFISDVTVVAPPPTSAEPIHGLSDTKELDEEILDNLHQGYPRSIEEWERFVIEGGRPGPTSYRSFVRAYAPIFISAAARTKSRFGGFFRDIPDDEIVIEVWGMFVSKLDNVLNGFKPGRTSLKAYLFTLASGMTLDYLRKKIKEQQGSENPDPLPENDDYRDAVDWKRLRQDWEKFMQEMYSRGKDYSEFGLLEISSKTFEARVEELRRKLKRSARER